MVRIAFDHAGLDYRRYVTVDPALFRPSEPAMLRGDATKARTQLDWHPTTTLEDTIREMVDADIARHQARLDR
jgi:GDPmannose 4,6-dehydratase